MHVSDADCPPAVIEYVRTVDLRSSENSTLFSWIASHSDLQCQVHSVGAVASRLDATSDLQVIDDFCGSVATYARFLEPDAKQKIQEAYLRFPYDSTSARTYFAGLRATGIDIRAHLEDKIVEDWSFSDPGDAETWHYYLYLASLGQPVAYEKLAKKIADTENGNDATLLIESLAELQTPQTREILLRYQDDSRTADSPEGPGVPISETVRLLLSATQ